MFILHTRVNHTVGLYTDNSIEISHPIDFIETDIDGHISNISLHQDIYSYDNKKFKFFLRINVLNRKKFSFNLYHIENFYL